ncbi:MAG: hypothetical protein WCD16_16690 [Paracoccaceae bacterium]
MHRLALCLPLALLTACATPRQQCERAATEDLNVVSALIVETQQNIARGYAVEKEVRTRPQLRFCYGDRFHRNNVGFAFCNEVEPYVVERPVAIDLAAEKAKLNSLRAKREELLIRSQAELADCAARYPAG